MNLQNLHIYSEENPPVTRSASFQRGFHVNVCVGIPGNTLSGPFIIEDRNERWKLPEYRSIEELVAKINTTAMEIRHRGLGNGSEIRRRAKACVGARGGHFEHLL